MDAQKTQSINIKEDTTIARVTKNLRLAKSSDFIKHSFLYSLLYIFIDAILHPWEAWNSFLPRFKMVQFDPKKDIPDMSGKVVLVTGGKCVCELRWNLLLMRHAKRQHRPWLRIS